MENIYITIAIPTLIGVAALVALAMHHLFRRSMISFQSEDLKVVKKADQANLSKNKLILFSAGLFLSLFIAVLAIESFAMYVFVPEEPLIYNAGEDEIIDIPITTQPPPPPPQKVKAPEIVEVPEEEIEEEEPKIEFNTEEETPVEEDYNEDAFEEEEEVVETILDPSEVAQQPEFPGGMPAFFSYLKNNFIISSRDYAEENKGTIYVKFVVEKNGTTSQIQIVRGVSEGLDKEALRVIKNSPRWKSGIGYNGAPARVWFTVPVKIRY